MANFKEFQEIGGISIYCLGAVAPRSSVLPLHESVARDQIWWLMSYDSACFVSGALNPRSAVLLG